MAVVKGFGAGGVVFIEAMVMEVEVDAAVFVVGRVMVEVIVLVVVDVVVVEVVELAVVDVFVNKGTVKAEVVIEEVLGLPETVIFRISDVKMEIVSWDTAGDIWKDVLMTGVEG